MTLKHPIEKAIFLGRELPIDAANTFAGWGFMYTDAEGNRVDPDTLPADHDPGSIKRLGVALNIGQQNYLPYWADEKILRDAVASENFAHPRMQEQIDGWVKEVSNGSELYQKVKEARGLITLKDVGLEPVDEPAQEETKSGG
jgi:hypothetical protein